MRDETSPSARSRLAQIQAKSSLFARPGFLIRRLHQIHTALFLEETRAFGITPVQYSLLSALLEHGEMDQNTLAMAIGLERTGVAEVLLRLVDRALLERRPSAEDKRVKLVRLSRAGRALVKRMHPCAQRAHDRTIAQLPASERAKFMLQMARLVEANNAQSAAPLRLI
jgi:MarR family transcriptional regulator, lower aerobic nicotinate degradation pathway regulator